MKQSQLAVAVLLLAGVVFAVTFAMNYLGGGSGHQVPQKQFSELMFAGKIYPFDPQAPMLSLDREHKAGGHRDFWFINANDKPVRFGIKAKNCKCHTVEGFVLPAAASAKLVPEAGSLGGPDALAKQVPDQPSSAQEAEATKKLFEKDSDFVEVPAGGVGWVRVTYKGRNPGPESVSATLWMDEPRDGPVAILELRVTFHEPFQVQPELDLGTLTEKELEAGFTRPIYVYSRIRKSVKLIAEGARSKGDAAGDPLEVGAPVRLDDAEQAKLKAYLSTIEFLCAYKIPITLRPVSADGKTPFDLGPFRRRVLVRSPDHDGDPVSVTIRGRVRGLIDVGGDESGEANFGVFASSAGRRIKVPLTSDLDGITLEVDSARMPEFLKATLTPIKGRTAWVMNLEVLPGKASGSFPRRDPMYEDSAVYLKATAPGKPTRAVRVGVSGTASGG